MQTDGTRYRIGPLTTYADPVDFERLFRGASAGDRFVYAIGPALGKDAAVARLARQFSDAGEAHLYRERDGRGWRYCIERRCDAAAAQVATTLPPGSEEARLLAFLAEHDGRVCPSYETMAEAADLPDRQAARYRLRKLERDGRIVVTGSGAARRVQIVAAGERTA